MKKIGPKKKLAYKMTNEELAEHTRQEVMQCWQQSCTTA
jgi:hypothetical protein